MHNLSNATYFQKRYHDEFCPNDIIVYTYYGEILTATTDYLLNGLGAILIKTIQYKIMEGSKRF